MKNKRKNDIFLIIIILIILIPLAVLFLLKGNGDKAIVRIDGEIVETLDLRNDGVYRYETENGFNIVEIKDSKVRVIEADCPDKICVRRGAIKTVGEVIACVPHKVLIEIAGA